VIISSDFLNTDKIQQNIIKFKVALEQNLHFINYNYINNYGLNAVNSCENIDLKKHKTIVHFKVKKFKCDYK
jgi:hypothetical protein